jgi:hypothetical protein
MFTTAQSITPAEPAKKSGKAKPEIHVKGVAELAMVRALEDALETVGSTFDREIKAAVFNHYFQQAQATGQRPESVRAIDGDASASVSLSKRATTSPLNEQQIAVLRENGLEPVREVLMQKLLAVNPKYAANEALLGKVTKALEKIVPEDFIVLQEERARYVITDAVLAQVFSKKAPREVLELCTSMSCKPQLAHTDINRILDFVRGLLTAPATAPAANVPPAPEAEKPAAKKSAKKVA